MSKSWVVENRFSKKYIFLFHVINRWIKQPIGFEWLGWNIHAYSLLLQILIHVQHLNLSSTTYFYIISPLPLLRYEITGNPITWYKWLVAGLKGDMNGIRTRTILGCVVRKVLYNILTTCTFVCFPVTVKTWLTFSGR